MFRIHREGKKTLLLFLAALVVVCAVVYSLMCFHSFLSSVILSAITWLAVASFFRNPIRITHAQVNEVIAPADGKVVVIEETEEKEYLNHRSRQISIFMSPANVHVNRVPVKGIIKYVKYHPGKYLAAWHPKSSTENERTTVVIDTGKEKILLRQIAGAVARRIVNYLHENQEVNTGEELGFIKFGSRVDIFIPLTASIKVTLNERVKGGVTVLAKLT